MGCRQIPVFAAPLPIYQMSNTGTFSTAMLKRIKVDMYRRGIASSPSRCKNPDALGSGSKGKPDGEPSKYSWHILLGGRGCFPVGDCTCPKRQQPFHRVDHSDDSNTNLDRNTKIAPQAKANTNTHSNSNTYSNANSNPNANSNTYSNANSNPNANSYTNANSNPNANSNSDTNAYPNAKPDPNSNPNGSLRERCLGSEPLDGCAGLQGVSEPDKRRSLHSCLR